MILCHIFWKLWTASKTFFPGVKIFKIGYLLVFSDRLSNMKGDVYYVTNVEQRKMNPLRNSNLWYRVYLDLISHTLDINKRTNWNIQRGIHRPGEKKICWFLFTLSIYETFNLIIWRCGFPSTISHQKRSSLR